MIAPPNEPERNVPGPWRFRAALMELLPWCVPALVIGAILRGWLLAHFPYAYVHPDSPDFLVTADRWLNHGKFVLHGKKAFLGPILFLLPMLVKVPTLLVVAWAQHLLGLIYVVMIGALVRCWTALWRWWIVPVTVLAAINPAALYYEHALIAESQYLVCVTALVLAGTAYVQERTRGRYILLLGALILTAGSRPEGKLYVVFCLLLVSLLHWGNRRALSVFGGITLAVCALTWISTRNTQAGSLLYATLLPLAPETPKSAPDFGPWIAPLRTERIAAGVLVMPDLVKEEKKVNAVVYAYLRSKNRETDEDGAFCQKLAVEAAKNHPVMLAPMALEKFLLGTRSPDNDGFGAEWLGPTQIESSTYKPWMLGLMKPLTGLPIRTEDDLRNYVARNFAPLQPDWFAGLQKMWLAATTGWRIRVPGLPVNTPGMPLVYLLGFAGMGAAIVRGGPMRKVHAAWIPTLGFVAGAVMLTGVVNPRYRFVFEPFAILYLFVLLDVLLLSAICAISAICRPAPAGDTHP